MSASTPNTLGWFEIATDDVDAQASFYAGLFGWTFVSDPNATAQGQDYRLAMPAGAQAPIGGLTTPPPGSPGHAVFSILVADVAAICASAADLGATVVASVPSPQAGPAFAYLRDPAGQLFQVFSPPSA
jgi:predicted enzyme related to lactoylglutathione lyase